MTAIDWILKMPDRIAASQGTRFGYRETQSQIPRPATTMAPITSPISQRRRSAPVSASVGTPSIGAGLPSVSST